MGQTIIYLAICNKTFNIMMCKILIGSQVLSYFRGLMAAWYIILPLRSSTVLENGINLRVKETASGILKRLLLDKDRQINF